MEDVLWLVTAASDHASGLEATMAKACLAFRGFEGAERQMQMTPAPLGPLRWIPRECHSRGIPSSGMAFRQCPSSVAEARGKGMCGEDPRLWDAAFWTLSPGGLMMSQGTDLVSLVVIFLTPSRLWMMPEQCFSRQRECRVCAVESKGS